MYSCDGKAEFQQSFSSLQSHMILKKSFKYSDLLLKKQFLLLSMLKIVVLVNIIVETVILNFRIPELHN